MSDSHCEEVKRVLDDFIGFKQCDRFARIQLQIQKNEKSTPVELMSEKARLLADYCT